ncbi:hypothetical protein [Burkholderia ubonensis]|nr:hypothetical protein [Burkholderia ubonensis]
MNLEIDGSGRIAFNAPQQRWVDPNGRDGERDANSAIRRPRNDGDHR